jgi:cytochrome c biogenesis protein CcdA
MQELLARLAEHAAAAPPLVTLLLVFLGGVISSASPCVLAAVPLVIATVGGTATSRARAVLLSVSFVLGLALCFTALTGRLIGDIGPWWNVVLGVLLVVMGLHLAGLVRLPLPALDGRRFRGAGVAGAFGLGALTGTLSSPCATPILVVVLSLVAFEKKVLWGTALLAAYSLGHVVLLFVAGAASGFAAAYLGSRAAVWAQRLHRGLGALMVGIGVWVLVPVAIGALAQ